MTSFWSAMAFWMAATRSGCQMTQRRWVTPYSSFTAVTGGTASASARMASMRRCAIAVEHEELAGVRAGVAKEFEAIGFGAGEGVLVAEDDAGGIFLELAGADEAAAGAALVGAGNGVFLGVGVEAVGVVLLDDSCVDPGLQGGLGAGVDVVFGIVVGENTALFYGDQIVGVGGVVALLGGGGDFVVGLGEDAVEGDFVGVVAKGAKGVDLSHEVSGENFSASRAYSFYAK